MGWITVDRQLFDHWIWAEKPFSRGQAWIDLIGLANFKDEKTPYRNQIISCKRGTVYRSISYLSRRWGWSRDKTRNFQDQATTNKATNRQRTSQRADSGPYKEKRRINKDKEGNEVCVTHTPPSFEEVVRAADEFGQNMTEDEAQRFIKYNSANGWKMEWHYALERWFDHTKEKQKEQENRWGNDPDQRKEYGGEIDWGC